MTVYATGLNLMTYVNDWGAGGTYISHVGASGSPTLIDWNTIIAANPGTPANWVTRLAGPGTSEWIIHYYGALSWDDKDVASNRPTDGKVTPNILIGFKATNRIGFTLPKTFAVKYNGVASGGGGGGPAPGPTITDQGFQPGQDYGTTADLYVAQADGNDANNGLTRVTAKKTMAAIVPLMAGKTVAIDEGVYRESLNVGGKAGSAIAPTRIRPYGTANVRITGYDPLGAGTYCAAGADDGILGAAKRPFIHYWDVPTSNFFGSDPLGCLLRENGNPLILAGEFGGSPRNPDHMDNYLDWDKADSYTTAVNGAGKTVLKTFTCASMLVGVPDAQVLASTIFHYINPQETQTNTVSAFNSATRTITLANGNTIISTTPNKDRLGIRNLPCRMTQGTWSYVINGATTRLYAWLNNPANAAANMEYSRRSNAIYGSGVHHFHIEGIILDGHGSNTASEIDTNHPISFNDNVQKDGIVIRNVLIKDMIHPRGRGGGGYVLKKAMNAIIENVTLRNIFRSFGFYMLGSGNEGSPAAYSSGSFLNKMYFENISHSPARFYSQWNLAFMNSTFGRDCAIAAHANSFNFYQYCNNVLAWAINCIGAGGYITWQNSDGVKIAFCLKVGNYKYDDERIMWDQGQAGTPNQPPGSLYPTAGLQIDFYSLNNTFVSDPQLYSTTRYIDVGPSVNAQFYFINCLLPSGDPTHFPSARCTRIANVVGDNSLAGSDVYEPKTTTFVDPVNGDFRIKAGSVVRTTPGASIASLVNAWKAAFPQVPAGAWVDINGDTINLAAPTRGAAMAFDIACPATSFIDPSIPSTQSPVSGTQLTWAPGYNAPAFHVPTYQHIQSADNGATWTNIPGETGANLSGGSANVTPFVGKRLGRDEFGQGGGKRRVLIANAVA